MSQILDDRERLMEDEKRWNGYSVNGQSIWSESELKLY